MKEASTSLALIVLASALAASIGVFLFASSLQGQIEASAQARDQGAVARDQDRSVAQLHALAQTTARERASLEGVLHTDVLSIATMIKAAGKDAGVELEVSDALSETTPALQGNTFTLQATGFTVQGSGSFAKLVSALYLLERLPVAGSVEHIDLARAPAEGNTHSTPSWHMEARIRVLTTVQNSP